MTRHCDKTVRRDAGTPLLANDQCDGRPWPRVRRPSLAAVPGHKGGTDGGGTCLNTAQADGRVELAAGGDPEFREHPVEVVADRLVRDVELLPDFPVG